MNRPTLRRLINADFENLLEMLTTRQHLAPHEPVSESLRRTIESVGVCPNAVEQAVQWLNLDPTKAIGRLRRTELMQLARSIHRFWRQPDPAPQARPQRQS